MSIADADDQFDVFCSYHRKNKTLVKSIVEKFQEYFSIWIDQDKDESQEDIEKALKQSRVVICFISKVFCKSKDCVEEVKLAAKLKKMRIAVVLDKKLVNSMTELTQSFLKVNAFEAPNTFDPWCEALFQKLLNIVLDLVDRRKPTLDQMIIDVNFLEPIIPVKGLKKDLEKPKSDIQLRPHVLKHIVDTMVPQKVDLSENTYCLLPLSNGQLFSCNARDGFTMYDEHFHALKTIKQSGVCCFKQKIYCYHATVDANENIVCCCEITPWNKDTFHGLLIADFNLKKIQVVATYGNDKQRFEYFQGIFNYKDSILISNSDNIIKLNNKTHVFESTKKLIDCEPNEVAILNDVLCVNTHKLIYFYDIDTFYIKYKYPSGGRFRHQISVVNSHFYIFGEYEKLQCFDQDGKLVETAEIFVSGSLCRHSRGRLVHFKDKILIQTSDHNVLSVYPLNDIMN